MAHCSRYKKAYQSMKACPIPFSHPCEAQILTGLGPKLCDRLADKLQEYCKENGLPMPEKKRVKEKRVGETTGETEDARPEKKARKAQLYVPKLRSGAYAIVMALATLDEEGNQGLSKNDLIEIAQPHCTSSFTAPSDPTKFFTAWNSMKTLESKELVCTKGHPTKRYYLSDEGWEVAKRMQEVNGEHTSPKKKKQLKEKEKEKKQPKVPESRSSVHFARASSATKPAAKPITMPAFEVMDLSSDPESPVDGPCEKVRMRSGLTGMKPDLGTLSSSGETISLPPGSYEIRLILDAREIRTTTDRDYISGELKKLGVAPIIRSLPLGDVLWVAHVNENFAPQLRTYNAGDEEEHNDEIVLDHIMERKRLDDLIGSIKDGRFNEQKFRLRKSGIQHVTYLIEDYSISAERSEKYGEAVESVIASMQVVSDIFVKQTSKLDNTIRYLARMTKRLQELYSRKDIRVIRSSLLESGSYLELLERLRKDSPTSAFGTTFSAFAAMCNKSDSMTLRDVYLKMLLCIRGVTSDKAVEIQKIWPTPQAFIEAFEAKKDGRGKENLVADRLADAIPRKKVGKALSMKIAEVWG